MRDMDKRHLYYILFKQKIQLNFLFFRYQSVEKADGGCQVDCETRANTFLRSDRELQLEPSKTINIDVPPSHRVHTNFQLQRLDSSETIHVNVPPSRPVVNATESEEEFSDTGYFGYPQSSSSAIMLEKVEDVLRQRINEHEKMEKHLRQQVSI